MPLTVVPESPADDCDNSTGDASPSLIDQIVREGARKMLAAALPAEVDAFIAAFADELAAVAVERAAAVSRAAGSSDRSGPWRGRDRGRRVLACPVLRAPKYAARLAGRSPAGAWRLLVALVRWLFDLEGRPERRAAATKEEPAQYLALSRQRDGWPSSSAAFDLPYRSIGEPLGLTEPNARQLIRQHSPSSRGRTDPTTVYRGWWVVRPPPASPYRSGETAVASLMAKATRMTAIQIDREDLEEQIGDQPPAQIVGERHADSRGSC